MGGCVSSVQKNPESSFKFRFPFGSKNDELVMPSPLKEKHFVNNDGDPTTSPADGLKSQWPPSEPVTTARRFESKEETFFDSQAWLESDCDDDFVSVNGDFTPSRGSTPVHHNLSAGTQPGSRQFLDDKTSAEPSPTGKKKRLSDLFEESSRSDQVLAYNNNQSGKNETKTTVIGLPPKSAESTPFASVAHSSACSSEQTPLGNYISEQEKSVKSVQCCLPRMLSSRSLKRIDSPAHSVRVV